MKSLKILLILVVMTYLGVSSALAAERGTVKWFNQEKGFGFITLDSNLRDIFFHQSAIREGMAITLQEGQCVEFEVQVGPKGTQAVDVRPCS